MGIYAQDKSSLGEGDEDELFSNAENTSDDCSSEDESNIDEVSSFICIQSGSSIIVLNT